MRIGFSLSGIAVALSVTAASPSEVAVGDRIATVVDSFARLEDAFGKPSIEVFLFSKPLADEAKRRLALMRNPTTADFEKLAPGVAPVMKALLFFSEGKACGGDSLLSATAVFVKTAAFDFPAATASPINWSFNRNRSASPTTIGISRLTCSFDDGGELSLGFKNEWVVEKGRGDADAILPPAVSSLRFRWDIDVKTKLITPAKAVETGGLTLETGAVKDVAIAWIAKPHLLTFRLFRRSLSDAERKAAAGYPPSMPMDAFLGAVSVFYPDEPSGFDAAKPTRAGLTLVVKEGAAFRMLDYPIVGAIKVTGEPSAGAHVSFQASGHAAGDPRIDQPPATWGLNLAGEVQQAIH